MEVFGFFDIGLMAGFWFVLLLHLMKINPLCPVCAFKRRLKKHLPRFIAGFLRGAAMDDDNPEAIVLRDAARIILEKNQSGG